MATQAKPACAGSELNHPGGYYMAMREFRCISPRRRALFIGTQVLTCGEKIAMLYLRYIEQFLRRMKLTAVFKKVSEGYIGFVEELPGANTQGETLAETRENLLEAINLVIEANRLLAEESLQGMEVIRESLSLSNL